MIKLLIRILTISIPILLYGLWTICAIQDRKDYKRCDSCGAFFDFWLSVHKALAVTIGILLAIFATIWAWV